MNGPAFDPRTELNGVGRGARRIRGIAPMSHVSRDFTRGALSDGAWVHGEQLVVACPNPACATSEGNHRTYLAGSRHERLGRCCLVCHTPLFRDPRDSAQPPSAGPASLHP